MDKKRLRAYIELSFAVVVWGASFIATKLTLRDLDPITVVWLRFTIGLVILGIVTAFRGQFTSPHLKDIVYLTLLGFLGIFFHQWLQSTALVTSQASTTAWIISSSPIFIAILGGIFLYEKILWVQVIGIILASLGVLLVVGEGKFNTIFENNFGRPGDFLILVSAINWAVFSILSRHGLQKYPATQMMFFVMAIGWFFISILLIGSGDIKDVRNLTTSSALGIAFLGIFCSGLAYIAWYDGLQVIPAAQVGAFLYFEPLVAVLFAWVLLGEKLSLATIFGGVVILSGVRLVQRQ
jgi:drug/metabolite transporter (DMT)-like permease